jgi:hypothetical protein
VLANETLGSGVSCLSLKVVEWMDLLWEVVEATVAQ